MEQKKVLNTLAAYGTGFQVKVLSSLLKEKEFLRSVHDIVSEDYFDSPAHKWIINEVMRYYYAYHTTPTMESLQVEVRKIDNEVLKIAVADQVKEALKVSNEDKVYIEQEFSNFCKNQHLKKALLSSVDLLHKGEYDNIRSLIDQALKAGQDKNIGHEYDKDIETRYQEEERSPIPTPWSNINELLMGGLGRGDLGIVLGGPGSGKSWVLVNLGSQAVLSGYNVLHYTLELPESYVGRRYDSLLTGIDVQQILLHKDKVEKIISELPGKLIVREYPMGKASSHTIENHIQKCKDMGFIPDLVIIDYIDLMKSGKSRKEAKEELDDIYIAVKGMARELNIPIWSVSQVNRAGAKDDIVEADKIAGSYNKIMVADFAMSLSRKRADKINKTGRIHIMKNRYGADGMTFAAKINTDNGNIVINTNELTEDAISIMEQNTVSESNSRIPEKMNPEEKQYLAKRFFELTKDLP
jgi:replicative DNA helicase